MKLYNRITALSAAVVMMINISFVGNVSAKEFDIPYATYSDIFLPEITENGDEIVWTSDTPSVITADGKVARPSYTEGTKNVTLTATVGGESECYEILVPHMGSTERKILSHDFNSADGLDMSALSNGAVTFENENGTTYMLLTNTKSNTSTVSLILDTPAGGASKVNVKLKLKPSKTSSFKFFSDKGYEVAKSQMHSSGTFMVGFSNLSTQKNIGAADTWLDLDYNFSFDTNNAKNSTFSLSSNGSSKYPAGTATFRANDNQAGTDIKKISIITSKSDSDNPGTAVDSIEISQSIEGDTEAAVAAAKKMLEIRNADNITGDIDLPKSIDGCEVVWVSSDKSVIENDGKVYLPEKGEASKYAELTAFIILGNSIEEKKFSLTLNPYVDKRLTDDADLVKIPDLTAGDIILPEFKNGTKATFITDVEGVLSSDGKITRPTDKSIILPFKIRFENDTDFIEREYKTVVAKEIPYLKMNMIYEDFEGISDPTDGLYFLNAGGESSGEVKVITDEISGSSVISSKSTGSNFTPEFRFANYYDKVVIEFDARLMGDGGNFAYIYGEGICSSMTYRNGSIEVRGAEKSIKFIENIGYDEWHTYKLMIDTTAFRNGTGDCVTNIWVDGVQLVEGLKTRQNSNFICRFLTAPQQGGEIRYDNLKVYTDTTETVNKAAEALELEGIDEICTDYIFPARTADGMDIEFISENPEYITSGGKVTRPKKNEEDKKVTVYALVYKDMFMSLKPLEFTILHQYSDSVSVEKDTDSLALGDLSDVRENIILPTLGANGSLITWETSDEAVVGKDGKVTRPGYIEGERYKEVTLYATIKKGEEVQKKQFTAYVAKNNFLNNTFVRCESEDVVNSAIYINDENYDTYWSPLTGGTQTIIADLSKSTLANKLVLFTVGNVGNVSLSYSLDGAKYYDLEKTEEKDGKIVADFDEKAVRYIKINASYSDGSGISEIELYSYMSELDLIKKDIEELKKIGFMGLKSDISLPENGENGSVIVWKSSDTNAIDDDGRVFQKSSAQTLTLTATLTIGSVSTSVDFPASVAAKSSGGTSGGGGGGGGGSSSGSAGASAVLPLFTNTQAVNNESAENNLFTDMSGFSWAEEAVNSLFDAGIVSGRGDKKFAPADFVTRAEFVKLLCGVIDIPEAFSEFSDVSDTDWFAPYVRRAAAAGIIFGSDGKFNPNNNITRQDMAVIIARALKLEANGDIQFVDSADISDYAHNGVAALAENKIMQGADGCFAPKRNATRAEAAMVIYTIYKGAERN